MTFTAMIDQVETKHAAASASLIVMPVAAKQDKKNMRNPYRRKIIWPPLILSAFDRVFQCADFGDRLCHDDAANQRCHE